MVGLLWRLDFPPWGILFRRKLVRKQTSLLWQSNLQSEGGILWTGGIQGRASKRLVSLSCNFLQHRPQQASRRRTFFAQKRHTEWFFSRLPFETVFNGFFGDGPNFDGFSGEPKISAKSIWKISLSSSSVKMGWLNGIGYCDDADGDVNVDAIFTVSLASVFFSSNVDDFGFESS